MLELRSIRKAYTTAGFTQVALDGVDLAFRDNEFVAILGTSGSGKTTMLNILGGLDHADSGDIVINGISTKDYKDKDWDTYRNHRIGFIFQSYNLIPHQSVLANVELALTLAGIGRAERRERARDALERVGLGEHMGKRPSQLSGGQMQRVAIARALVNDPDIVLADEPTGALDTDTGLQVMELLKEIASDRLVIMVTHNPELAEQYATRIVRLRDGRIEGDSDPLDAAELFATEVLPARASLEHEDSHSGEAKAATEDSYKRHASMSFFTALALSFTNLMTKKGRTFMTAFAGSIGIIGIAAILSLSNGVNAYIAKTEEEALSSYPLTITKSSFDISNLMLAGVVSNSSSDDVTEASDSLVIPEYTIMTDMFAQVKNNDLRAFKHYLDSGAANIEPYVNAIQYEYGIVPYIFEANTADGVVQLNPSFMATTLSNGIMGSALTGGASMSSFDELMDDRDLLEQQLEVVAGRWPDAYDEAVLVLNRNGGISDYTLYSLGVYDPAVMKTMTQDALAGEEVTVPETDGIFTIDDALKLEFKVLPASSLYRKNAETGSWTDMSSDNDYLREKLDTSAVTLKVVGVLKRSADASTSSVSEGIAYTTGLTDRLIELADASDIVSEQKAQPDVDVFTGKTFDELADERGAEFDFSSMFSVDEEAIKNAFSFDASALSGAGSGITLDTSSLDLSQAFSGFDLSSLPLDTSSLGSVFSEDAIASLMGAAPRFSLSDADLADIADGITDEQRMQLQGMVDRLAAGFMSWMIMNGRMPLNPAEANYAELFGEYIATDPSALELLGEMQESFGTSLEGIIGTAMQSYMTNQFAPYFASAMQQMMAQAARVMATQMASGLQTQMAAATAQIGSQLTSAIASSLSGQMASLTSALQDGFSVDVGAFANAIQFNMTQEDLTSLLTNYMNSDELSYDSNMVKLGYAEEDSPSSISIFPIDFEAKEFVLKAIDDYNAHMLEADGEDAATIQYSDIAGTLMRSVTDIVNMISLVLIAFVSISLVVSSIMIGIITYISVLERKKEIGILRAMGASKFNVANVFNAETVIEGLMAGLFAMAVVYSASIPVNAIVLETHNVAGIMRLPFESALVLVAVSVVLTLVAGILPSSSAARRDPVEALRSE